MRNKTNGIGKLSTLLTALVFAGIVHAADNSIYVDQSGDNATISMIQDGASNQVHSVSGAKDTAAKLYGDGLQVDIQQTGSGNQLSLGVQTGQAGGISSGIIYHVTGNSGTAIIDMNNLGTTPSLANAISVNQIGDNAYTEIHMTGSNNAMQVLQSGGNNNKFIATVGAGSTSVSVNQTGGGNNQTTLNLTGDKGIVEIVTVGASNTIDVTQSGGGVNGHYAKIDITGSSNSATVSQSGSIDMVTNIKSVGNGNSFSVIQRN